MENHTSPKDVFLHLFSIVALYIAVGSFITLLFQYINIFIPDTLDYYGVQSAQGTIRWAIATLIIIFPAYIGSVWLLHRGYSVNPATRGLRTRKWLVYFTLFLAAAIIAGDLVSLVYNLLNGDLTARFLWKAATIFFVSGSVFGYYFGEIKKSA